MSLKRELETSKSPLRVWLDAQPLRTAEVRIEFVAACRPRQPLLPESGTARPDWTLLGNASGLGVVWHLDPALPPATVEGASFMGSLRFDPELNDVVETADWFEEFAAAWVAGPSGDPVRDGATATIAGVFERLTRTGYTPGRDKVHDVVYNAATFEEAIAGIPDWISTDVAAVSRRGADAFVGDLGELTVGPAFAGSPLVGGADADFIADNALWDVKALTKAELRARDIHQIIGYALLDFDDEHEIRHVGICSSRHGVTMVWDVEWLLGCDLHSARREVRELLESPFV